jgi:hypothetical protein
MASYTVNKAKHAVLTPDTVDTVSFGDSVSFVIISNRTTSGSPIFFTYGDPTKGVPTPTVNGDDCYVVGIGMTLSLVGDGTASDVKLISNAAQAYSVMVV